MDIGYVLKRAWEIIWKHKILWIFGILAGCSGSNSGVNNIQFSYQVELPPQIQNFFDRIFAENWQNGLFVGIVLLVVLILVVLAVFLTTIGQIGLIRGTTQAEQGAATLVFKDLFNGSLPYFWRVFGLSLLVGLAVALVFIMIIIGGIVGTVFTLGLFILFLIPLFCLLIPVSWAVSIFLMQAIIAIVVENLSIKAGLRRGWEVVKNNVAMILVMAIILGIGSLIVSFILGLPAIGIILPAVFGGMAETSRAQYGGLLVTLICLVPYIPVLIFLTGVMQSYITSAWTLTYLRLTRNPASPKLSSPTPAM